MSRPTVDIRLATVADLPAIVTIYNQAIEECTTADLDPATVENRDDWFRSHQETHRPLLVAVKRYTAGRTAAEPGHSLIVGWCSLSDHRPGRAALRESAEISYYVDRDHRREGIASSLIAYVLEQSPTWKIRVLFGILLEENQPSIRLLERWGFRRWAHLPEVARFGDRFVGQVYYGRSVEPDGDGKSAGQEGASAR